MVHYRKKRRYRYALRIGTVALVVALALVLSPSTVSAETQDTVPSLIDANEAALPDQPFAFIVFRDEIDDAIAGQRCVFPVTVVEEGSGPGAGDPVTLSVAMGEQAFDASISVEPNTIRPGEVAELTIVPLPEPNDVNPEAPEDREKEMFFTILAERGDAKRIRLIEINVLPGEDGLVESAAILRDLFIPWLAQQHPDLGITEQTQWTGTIVNPHILIVATYLFYSPEWEMGLRWHVMIPPHDWVEIYLRHRTELSSTRAWWIRSIDGGLPPEIKELPPEGLFR